MRRYLVTLALMLCVTTTIIRPDGSIRHGTQCGGSIVCY
jgi:hypothetical protein